VETYLQQDEKGVVSLLITATPVIDGFCLPHSSYEAVLQEQPKGEPQIELDTMLQENLENVEETLAEALYGSGWLYSSWLVRSSV